MKDAASRAEFAELLQRHRGLVFMRPVLAGQVLTGAIGIACTVFFARFWLAHLDEPAALA